MIIFQKKFKFEKDFNKIFSVVQKRFHKRKMEVFFDNITESKIAKINQDLRKLAKPTDVLSFANFDIYQGNFDKINRKLFLDPSNGYVMLGEILICDKIAKKQAKEYGHSERREYCFLFLHGLLHLFGFDHENDQDRGVMEQVANEILTSLGILR